MATYWTQYAALPEGIRAGVRLVEEDGRWVDIQPGVPRPQTDGRPADGRPEDGRPGDGRSGQGRPAGRGEQDVEVWDGVTLPGMANCHSHAFHRALRGRTHGEGGTFWTWRERMYAVAARLTPAHYHALARAVYAEMALAGVTSVGEFHYVHHRPDGSPYEPQDAMDEALRTAAREAGVRLTLLDTCYLEGGLTAGGHSPLSQEQARFGDGSVESWARRHAALEGDDNTVIGAAIHSVRAVRRQDLPAVVQACDGQPLHAHVSEQPAENEAARAFYGRTPVELLAEAGALGERFTAVHATHLTGTDIEALGAAGATACFCPSTERDLADGIGPAVELLRSGARLSLGSDQHAIIDMFDDARALELHERLMTHERGRLQQPELLAAATRHETIGWPDAGSLSVGARADAVAVSLTSPHTAGVLPAQVLMAAAVGDVRHVLCGGRRTVRDGRHGLGDVGSLLTDAINELWDTTGEPVPDDDAAERAAAEVRS